MASENYLDRRILRTRDGLKESLMRSLENTSLPQISIKDISEDAGINRSTFYSHYTDKYDLLRAAIEEYASLKFQDITDLKEINAVVLQKIFMNVAMFLKEVRETYAINFGEMALYVEEQVKKDLQRIFYRIEAEVTNHQDLKMIHTSSIMLSWGVYGAALEWVNNSNDSAEEYIRSVIPSLLHGLTSIQ